MREEEGKKTQEVKLKTITIKELDNNTQVLKKDREDAIPFVRHTVQKNPDASKDQTAQLIEVVKLALRHPNFLMPLSMTEDEKNSSVDFNMEYANAGSLNSLILFFKKEDLVNVAKSVARQLVSALSYMEVVHDRYYPTLDSKKIFLRSDGCVKLSPFVSISDKTKKPTNLGKNNLGAVILSIIMCHNSFELDRLLEKCTEHTEGWKEALKKFIPDEALCYFTTRCFEKTPAMTLVEAAALTMVLGGFNIDNPETGDPLTDKTLDPFATPEKALKKDVAEGIEFAGNEIALWLQKLIPLLNESVSPKNIQEGVSKAEEKEKIITEIARLLLLGLQSWEKKRKISPPLRTKVDKEMRELVKEIQEPAWKAMKMPISVASHNREKGRVQIPKLPSEEFEFVMIERGRWGEPSAKIYNILYSSMEVKDSAETLKNELIQLQDNLIRQNAYINDKKMGKQKQNLAERFCQMISKNEKHIKNNLEIKILIVKLGALLGLDQEIKEIKSDVFDVVKADIMHIFSDADYRGTVNRINRLCGNEKKILKELESFKDFKHDPNLKPLVDEAKKILTSYYPSLAAVKQAAISPHQKAPGLFKQGGGSSSAAAASPEELGKKEEPEPS